MPDPSISYVLEALLFPPAGPLLLLVLAALVRLRWRNFGRALSVVALITLYLASAPFVAQRLIGLIEEGPVLTPVEAPRAQAEAIVVLGGDRYRGAPEYGGDVSGAAELERARFAAALQRSTGLPIVALGGDAFADKPEGAPLLTQLLEEEFLVPVRFSDARSRNTFDNARHAREMLHPLGMRRVIVVTHAWHMSRAIAAFALHGFDPIPAPTAFHTTAPQEQGWLAFVPRESALYATRHVLHELIGTLWYRLAYSAENEGG